MNKLVNKKFNKKRGMALLAALGVLMLLGVASSSYMDSATHSARTAKRQTADVQVTGVCEAGVQSMLRSLWRPFKVNQDFVDMDDLCDGASLGSPSAALTGEITGVGKFASGVISYTTPAGNSYARTLTIRSVGWLDKNGNNIADTNEPKKTVDVQARYELARSGVFDYTYFVNNYGWMNGFGQNDLVVNGDMRANGNFDFTGGNPTINGTILACNNDKLVPAAPGRIFGSPYKQTNGTYATAAASNSRARPVYDSSTLGAKGSNTYEAWRDFVFDTEGQVVNGRLAGSALADASGTRSWVNTGGGAMTTNVLDSDPTKELIMPDLQNISEYQALSSAYSDPKATFGDGTANPGFGQPAYLEVWDASAGGGSGAYTRITTNGVLTGSTIVVGTSTRPIKIHGPVTITQDCVIKGYVQGQGTVYAGRNVHIVGNITYSNPPDFRGANPTTVEQANEKKDIVALCARGSVILGNPQSFGYYPLYYMQPPFTKARYDEDGTLIPAYDGTQKDATGFKKYQSVFGDKALNDISSGVNRIDSILYSNFVGGGNIGTGGGGVEFNGTLICRDEALVTMSLPIKMNYDNRIREKALTKKPVIDIRLPRSPVLLRNTWQDRGFLWNTGGSTVNHND
ncbi:MAG: hypothetical protein K8R88_09230 [Armatimonadetes bacterium]|nr:hypothetical protein [Armatimonadota bacterium]